MVATEFTGEDGKPDAVTAKAVAGAALKHRLMLLTCGTYGNVIRWIPPLIVTREQLDEGLDIFAQALADVVG
jgi:4-aminobutyrate aminotransferase